MNNCIFPNVGIISSPRHYDIFFASSLITDKQTFFLSSNWLMLFFCKNLFFRLSTRHHLQLILQFMILAMKTSKKPEILYLVTMSTPLLLWAPLVFQVFQETMGSSENGTRRWARKMFRNWKVITRHNSKIFNKMRWKWNLALSTRFIRYEQCRGW